jgi:UDP-N-acetylglucosamine 4,6-dehydratase
MKYLIFGGTGSLGYQLNQHLLADHKVINYSRDECKHWKMRLHFHNNKNQSFIVGDSANYEMVKKAMVRTKPDVVIIAQAMKHIDLAEKDIEACLHNNLNSVKTVLDVCEECTINTTVFISSDKACSPINSYGMCKALCENLVMNKALNVSPSGPTQRYVCVRYGNVLNSNGSIIPILHAKGQDPDFANFTLTHHEMTRFCMTLDEAVGLIFKAIDEGRNGDTWIPIIRAMKIKHLIELFADKYNKPVRETGMRTGEKLHEALINEPQSMRTVPVNEDYFVIKSIHDVGIKNESPRQYDSSHHISKSSLKTFLEKNGLL